MDFKRWLTALTLACWWLTAGCADDGNDDLVARGTGDTDGGEENAEPPPATDNVNEAGMSMTSPPADAGEVVDPAADATVVDPVDSGTAGADAGDGTDAAMSMMPLDASVDSGPPVSCDLGEACCPTDSCQNGYACAGDLCGCVLAIHGDHALRSDGTVIRYGALNEVVQEGDTGQPLDGITHIHQGFRHGCGRRDDGTVWCWPTSTASNNNVGQLGNGTFTNASTAWRATQVLKGPADPLVNVRELNNGGAPCSNSAMCGILQDGTVWCWGTWQSAGGGGALFHETQANQAYAVQMRFDASTFMTGVEQVSLGDRSYCVRLTGGAVRCWGADIQGALGDGPSTAAQPYPVDISLPGPATKVGTGPDSGCALVGDAVYCWGYNNNGQVGVGIPMSNHDGCINWCVQSPQRVLVSADDSDPNTTKFMGTPLDGVADLLVGYLANCARRNDNTLWCWGWGADNVAVPMSLGSPTPAALDDISQFTSCGSAALTSTLRWLNRDGTLQRPNEETTQECPGPLAND